MIKNFTEFRRFIVKLVINEAQCAYAKRVVILFVFTPFVDSLLSFPKATVLSSFSVNIRQIVSDIPRFENGIEFHDYISPLHLTFYLFRKNVFPTKKRKKQKI